MDISGTFSRVPTWGWAVGGILIVGALFLSTRSSGTSTQSTALPAADVNDILNQLQDAANLVGGQTTTKTVTVKEKSLWGSDVPAGIANRLSSESAATLFKKYGINFGTTINMGDLERLLKRMKIKYGKQVNYKDLVKAGVIANLPTTESTTTETATVQSSNNEVDG